MKLSRLSILSGVSAAAAILAFTGLSSAQQAVAEPFGNLATPRGITIQPLDKAQGYGLDKSTATRVVRDEIVFADEKGMTLYTFAQDLPGKPTCGAVDDCSKTWHPAIARADAQPVEGWSLIDIGEGKKQWAYQDKPLYTYSGDVDIGSVYGNSPARFGRGPKIGPRGQQSPSIPKDKPLPEGWGPAYMYPAVNVTMPGGFAVREVEDAMALTFVETLGGKTLYVFNGDAKKAEKECADIACRSLWRPVAAPRLAKSTGDFSAVMRDDGINQWTYKGRALFSYNDDYSEGDAFGMNVDKRFSVAAYKRYWNPPTVTTQRTSQMGIVLATAEGKSLYRRSNYIFQSGGGHSLKRGDPIRPAVGRDLGADPRCKSECDKWHPFLAPADAQPWGDWSVVTRPDGKKQWTHRGFALWTFDGDKAPGDLNGNDKTDIIVSEDTTTIVDIGTPYYGPQVLFWIAAYP
ncbi:MAG: hypothetical protein AB7E79_16815 [Rhodospirillaceae bacterium]